MKKNVAENELLSAYLDGELSAPQRAEVERLLAGSPAARQVLQELRALRETLQSLPPYGLGEDLGPRVLEQAERQILSDRLPADERPRPNGFAWWSVVREHIHLRALVWSGIVIAVAVMFMLSDRGRQRGAPLSSPIARAPAAHRDVADSPARDEDQAPSIRAAPLGRPAPSMSATPREAPVAGKPAMSLDREAKPKLKDEKSLPFQAEAAAKPASPQDVGNRPVAAGEGRARKSDDQGRELDRSKQVEASTLRAGSEAANQTTASASAKGPAGGESQSAGQIEGELLGEGFLVVECYLSAEAAKNHEFDKLLARQPMLQNLAQQPMNQNQASRQTAKNLNQSTTALNSLEQSKEALPENRVTESSGQNGAQSFGGLQRGTGDRARAGQVAADDLRGNDQRATRGEQEATRLVYQEGTPSQLKAMLGELAARPDWFTTVKVQPALGNAMHQALQEYTLRQRQLVEGGKESGWGFRTSGASAGPASSTSPAAASAAAHGAVFSSKGGAARPAAPAPSRRAVPKAAGRVAAPHDASKQRRQERTYRVLFVVHGETPSAPAAAERH